MDKIVQKEMAWQFLKNSLAERGCKTIYSREENKQRDLFLVFENKGEPVKAYVKFRRDFFMTFSKQFARQIGEQKDLQELGSIGESINEETLDWAIENNCEALFFVYENKRIYFVPPLLFKKFAESHDLIRMQERGNEYNRADGSGKNAIIQEKTLSIPIKLLLPLNDFFETDEVLSHDF